MGPERILPAPQADHRLALAPGPKTAPSARTRSSRPPGSLRRRRCLSLLPHLDTPPARTLSQSSVQENPRAQDHTTIWHWVQRDGPELEERLRHHLKPTTKSWRVDETYVRVKGRWCYLYRAIDSSGATIDFVLSRWRDAATATRLFRKALTDPSHPQPRVINTDQARLYGSAIAGVKKTGILRRRCRHRPVQYVNNIVEPDHRAIKRRVTAKQGFRAFFHAARRTIQGYEAMHMIRKGQARWVSGSDGRRQIQFINKLFGVVA